MITYFLFLRSFPGRSEIERKPCPGARSRFPGRVFMPFRRDCLSRLPTSHLHLQAVPCPPRERVKHRDSRDKKARAEVAGLEVMFSRFGFIIVLEIL